MPDQKYYRGYYDYFSPKGATTYGNPSKGGSSTTFNTPQGVQL